jgi:transcriptional regulator with AAA-type ATPase domain
LVADNELFGRPTERLILGRSLPLLRTLREARAKLRHGSGNMMILGPQGAGKTTLAEYLHARSGRPGQFVSYTTQKSTAQVQYKTLFGAWEGSYTGQAPDSERGLAEEANQGTLFLDEIHNLAPDNQDEMLEFARRQPDGTRRLTRLGRFPSHPGQRSKGG